MSGVAYTTHTGQHEAGTVENVIRYAADRFNNAGIAFPHSKLVNRIRRVFRAGGHAAATSVVDEFITATGKRHYAATWAGFELFTATGYADPTGARAAQQVDNARDSSSGGGAL